jgi:N-acetylmuramoyl-L-alanine amidase
MAIMGRRLPFVVLVLGLSFGLLAIACGGGAGTSAGNGQRITDPARVPSSTPIVNPVLYTIRQDGQVSTSGGPSSTVPANSTAPSAAKTVTVVSGDTCSAIAAKYGITLDELLKANRLIDAGCTNIHVGDPIKIPAPATPASTVSSGPIGGPTPKPSGKTYIVASGDTCSGIAQSYSVKVADLIAANGLDADCRTLKPGQTLKIP